MLIFSQKIMLMREFSQKRLLKYWFVQDSQVSAFLEEIDLKVLAERKLIDFIYLGHILSNSAVLNYSADKAKLRTLIRTYEAEMKSQMRKDQSSSSEEDKTLQNFHWSKLGGKLTKALEILQQE